MFSVILKTKWQSVDIENSLGNMCLWCTCFAIAILWILMPLAKIKKPSPEENASCCLARAVHKSRETKNHRNLWFLNEWCIFPFPIYWKTFTFAVVLHNESSSWSFRITAQKAGLRPMMRLSPWRVIALEITWNNFSGWGGWVGNWKPGAEFFFG